MIDRARNDCPEPAALLQAVDAVLPQADQSVVSAHLRACVRCQALLKEVDWVAQTALADEAAMAAFDPGVEEARFVARLHARRDADPRRRPGVSIWRWWPAAVPVAALLILGLSWLWRPAPSLSPDDLLARADAAARAYRVASRPAFRLHLTHETADSGAAGSVRIVQTSFEGSGDDLALAVQRQMPPQVIAALASYQVDWQNPLRVDRLQAWRKTRVEKRDDVWTAQDKTLLVLRTTTTDGVLSAIEVSMSPETFRIVRQSLIFSRIGRVDIEEFTPSPEPPRATTVPSRPTAVPPPLDRESLERVELQARLLLGQAGLDTRGSVRVSRGNQTIRIEGTVAAGTPYRATRAQLAALPQVSVALHVQDAETSDQQQREDAPPMSPEFSRWFHRSVRGDDGSTFVPELTRAVAMVGKRLRVLHELDQRYPEADVITWPTERKAMLQQLLRLHYQALNTDLQELDTRLKTLCGRTSVEPPYSEVPADWRARAVKGMSQAAMLDRLVQDTVAQDGLTPTQQRRLSTTFTALWQGVLGPARPTLQPK